MNEAPPPRADMPVPRDVIEYCAGRLRTLKIQSSRPWLHEATSHDNVLSVADMAFLSSVAARVPEARRSIPKSLAIWETSDFYSHAIPIAVFDLANGPFSRFEYFELLYVEMLGERVRPWLPSLYLGALASPIINVDFRLKLLRNFDEDRLRVEEEADRRRGLLTDGC